MEPLHRAGIDLTRARARHALEVIADWEHPVRQLEMLPGLAVVLNPHHWRDRTLEMIAFGAVDFGCHNFTNATDNAPVVRGFPVRGLCIIFRDEHDVPHGWGISGRKHIEAEAS